MVNETGIHSGHVIETLLLAAKFVPYHGSLAWIHDSLVVGQVTWVCYQYRISCIRIMRILLLWKTHE